MDKFRKDKFSFIVILAIAIVTTIFLNGCKSSPLPKSPDIYYISPDGNDNFSGLYAANDLYKKDGPFKTIEKAKEVIRKRNSSRKVSNITVYLRAGSYYVNSTVTFDEQDCSGENKVTFKNYPGENPILIGGIKINNWQRYKGNIYIAHVGTITANCIYENERRGEKARYPNEGYSMTAGMISKNSNTSFIFLPKDMPVTKNQDELQICIWPGGEDGDISWFFDQRNIKKINRVTNVIELNNETSYEIGSGSRYYIQGGLELLDRAGEYYLDKAHGDLYYWPYNWPIEKQEIIFPRLTSIISFNGSSNNMVSNITFDGLSFAGTDTTEQYDSEGLISLSHYSRNITIKNCRIYNAGSVGILILGASQQNMIYGNLIYDTGYDGVRISASISSKYINKNNSVINNYIHDTGQVVRHAKGICIDNSGDNEITNNTIKNIPRTGISLISQRPGTIIGTKIDGILVTRKNAKDFANCRNNIVEYNDISNAVQDSQDAGLIGCWGVGPGNVINNNYLHDSDVSFSFGVGIYIDDGSDYVTIENNILTRLQKKNPEGRLVSPIYVKGIENKIVNNICINNDDRATGIQTFQMNDEANNNIIIERNIFYNTGIYLYKFVNWDNNRFKYSDYNLFYNTTGSYLINGAPKVSEFKDWVNAFNGKYDQHSLIEDPLFMDPKSGDYRLRYDSNAYKLGFKDISLEKVGLLPDFKYIDKKEVIDRIFVKTDKGGDRAWVELKVGEGDKFILTARTITGYSNDLKEARIEYLSSSNSIASVDKSGGIYAKAKGTAKIAIHVSRSNKTFTSYFYVVVK